jgi:hypothetical protein
VARLVHPKATSEADSSDRRAVDRGAGEWSYDVGASVRLALVGADEETAGFVRAQLEPYAPVPADGEPPDVVIEAAGDAATAAPIVDIQRSAGDGLVTGWDGARLHVLHNGLSCALPTGLGDAPATFVYQPGFRLNRIFGRVVRPTLQLALLPRGAVAVHAACVQLEGGAVIVAGWSESGKTETALALAERGARFISDKWTILRPDGTAAAFPISVGIRRWTLAYLPQLRAALPLGARAQFAAARLATGALRPFGRLAAARPAFAALEQAVELGDRVALTPLQIRAAYGQGASGWSSDVRALVLLTTVPGNDVRVDVVDTPWAAARLARSAAFERRGLADLYGRLRFVAPGDERNPVDQAARTEEILLRGLLGNVPVIGVRAPFPCDPRRVAGAIASCL